MLRVLASRVRVLASFATKPKLKSRPLSLHSEPQVMRSSWSTGSGKAAISYWW